MLPIVDGIPSRDLGEHRLAGLTRPERIHQLLADDLPRDFPPLRNTISMLGAGITVVLADDTVLLREGIARLLADAGFDVVAQSGNPEDLLRHVAMHSPGVAIVDIRMPPTHTDEGLRAAAEIRRNHSDTGVLVLSQYVEAAYAMDLFSETTEGLGYLLKDRVADFDEFASAVRRVAEGGSALDSAVVAELFGRSRQDDPLSLLTPREREVLELMAEGRSNQAIADQLFVTQRAVEKHVTSIFVKLEFPRRRTIIGACSQCLPSYALGGGLLAASEALELLARLVVELVANPPASATLLAFDVLHGSELVEERARRHLAHLLPGCPAHGVV